MEILKGATVRRWDQLVEQRVPFSAFLPRLDLARASWAKYGLLCSRLDIYWSFNFELKPVSLLRCFLWLLSAFISPSEMNRVLCIEGTKISQAYLTIALINWHGVTSHFQSYPDLSLPDNLIHLSGWSKSKWGWISLWMFDYILVICSQAYRFGWLYRFFYLFRYMNLNFFPTRWVLKYFHISGLTFRQNSNLIMIKKHNWLLKGFSKFGYLNAFASKYLFYLHNKLWEFLKSISAILVSLLSYYWFAIDRIALTIIDVLRLIFKAYLNWN